MQQKVTKSLSVEAALASRQWYVIDANEQVLGRLATRGAGVLRGKHNPAFTPHVDCGDFVVVVNADKIRITGNKAKGKIHYTHSGFPGGTKARTAGDLLQKDPEKLIRQAIVGMLPRNRLGRQLATKLKIYTGAEHPHVAQQPQQLAVS
jgi:large subunit ribosomal protein L13